MKEIYDIIDGIANAGVVRVLNQMDAVCKANANFSHDPDRVFGAWAIHLESGETLRFDTPEEAVEAAGKLGDKE